MRRRRFIGLLGGAAAAWPLTAHAQERRRMRRIGFLMGTSETDLNEQSSVAAFVQTLERLGWVAGKNIEIEYRWTAGDPRRMQEYAQELVALSPDVIFAKGAAAPPVTQATTTIPVVFAVLSDMLAQRYVKNFARPDRNVTGFASDEITLVSKRVEILKEISPSLTRVLYVRGARPKARALFLRLAEDAAQLALAVTECAAENEADVASAIAAFARDPNGGLSVGFDVFNVVHRKKIVELAALHRLPAIYFARFFVVEDGGLLSYGPNQPEQFRQAAQYVDRILKGEKVVSLPVQAPTKYDFTINLKTANALGLRLPPTVLSRADELIE